MRHWRKTSGAPIVRVASSFSLFAAAALAMCGQYRDLEASLAAAKTAQAKVDILQNAVIDDPQLVAYAGQATANNPGTVEQAVRFVSLKAMAESAGKPADQSRRLKEIKSSVLYNDEGAKEQANWLSGAIARLRNLVPKFDAPRTRGPGIRPPAFAPVLIYLVWFLLAAAVLAFIVYALRFVSFAKLKHRKAKAMLADDEPERTLDEWLALAQSLELEGRYREAVRALYLACLLKFDERNIARFIRSQTNWEHLARIEGSPRRPSNLDFRTPTGAFDRIWYGFKGRGREDVDDFRQYYGRVCDALREDAAA